MVPRSVRGWKNALDAYIEFAYNGTSPLKVANTTEMSTVGTLNTIEGA